MQTSLNLTGAALTPGAQRSWWLREALAHDPGRPCPALSGDVNADVVIVGGGFTGLWTAFFLTERDSDLGVVVLEQDICGGGASGRNGGFVLSWWSKVASLLKLFGRTEALRIGHASEMAITEIEAFCTAHSVDARMRRNG